MIAIDQTAIVKLFILYAAVARAVGKAFACGESAHYLALVCVNVGNKVNENDGELQLGMTRFRKFL